MPYSIRYEFIPLGLIAWCDAPDLSTFVKSLMMAKRLDFRALEVRVN